MNGVTLNDCGCCEGLTAETPASIENRAGLTAIAYRCGTHSQFKESMLAALSSSDRLALQRLNTRENDDFSIALLDAWAVVADVITFYQERIANESFLRTATERLSLLELARLIGYELRPGVAASAYLAFTLENAEGAPRTTKIDIGTRVQSIPGPNEQPQTFETIEKFEARVEWNALKVPLFELILPGVGTDHLYLQGVATNLKPGDPLLFVGAAREPNSTSNQWDFRRLTLVTPEHDANRTRIEWADGLTASSPKVYALRQRASLFGFNAPHPSTLSDPILNHYGQLPANDWPLALSSTIDLDTTYPSMLKESWLVLSNSSSSGQELYRAASVSEASRTACTLSGKTTRVVLDSSTNLDKFFTATTGTPLAVGAHNIYRDTTVFAQSELLELAEESIADPVHGASIDFVGAVHGLAPNQALAISGKRLRVEVVKGAGAVSFEPDNGSPVALQPGDSLQLLGPPSVVPSRFFISHQLFPHELTQARSFFPTERFRWRLIDRNGLTGSVTTFADRLQLAPATKEDAIVSEIAFIANTPTAITSDRDSTTLELQEALQNSYDRTTFAANANVALATHGETKNEVLGSGNASQPYQRFTLKQPPLTFVHGASASGTESTLAVRVNDVLWHETPTLFGRGPRNRVFISRTDDDGKTTVEFGDGITGARLPSGQENVRATYRKGIGLEGLVKAEQLSLLMSPPLGVKAVTNPKDADGAADPESLDGARVNAPLTVLTLDRIVSLRDYEDFVRSYAGVAKALATWTWDGHTRGVFITVAGPKGAEINLAGDFGKNLMLAMRKSGDPFVPVQVKSYKKNVALFHLAARVKVDADYETAKVLGAVESALRTQFSFDARSFGQPVVSSEVIAVMQSVPGVIAIDLNKIYRVGGLASDRLVAALPQHDPDTGLQPAELIVLDSAPLDQLDVMQ
jgi:hypothetical protein